MIPMFSLGCSNDRLEPSKLAYRKTDLNAIRAASDNLGSIMSAIIVLCECDYYHRRKCHIASNSQRFQTRSRIIFSEEGIFFFSETERSGGCFHEDIKTRRSCKVPRPSFCTRNIKTPFISKNQAWKNQSPAIF